MFSRTNSMGMQRGASSRILSMAVAFGLTVMASFTTAQANTLDKVKQRGKLICGTVTTTEPLGFRDHKTGQAVGFDVDICRAIAEHLGVGFEQQSLSLESRIPELQLGRVDILSALLGYTAERAKQIEYTHSHFQVPIRIFVPVDSALKTMDDIDGQKIGSGVSSTPDYWLRRSYPKAVSVTYRDASATFLALQQGKIAGQGITQTSGARFLNAGKGSYRYLNGTLGWEPNALGIKKGETAFLAEVNKALETMEAEGEIDRIWNRWFGPDTAYNIPRVKRLTPIDDVAEDMAKN